MKRVLSVILVLALLCGMACFAEEKWTCPSCGREGNSGKFCGECGAKQPEEGWMCPTCGASNKGAFCGYCGTAKPGAEAATTPAPTPTATPTATPVPANTPAPIWFKGDIVQLGSYEQDANRFNGKEAIEWIVLDVKGDEALLISKYALDVQPYHAFYTDITWEECTLRTWLNDLFYSEAFSANEREYILTSPLTAAANASYGTSAGNATEDKVFLMSADEADQYLGSAELRMCGATNYALELNAFTGSGYEVNGQPCCDWWLRTPGYNSRCAEDVYINGEVYTDGIPVQNADGIRPCIRVRTARDIRVVEH